jgi:hypothetical protein
MPARLSVALPVVLLFAPVCWAGPHAPASPSCAPPVIEKTIPSTQVLLVPTEQATTIPDWKLREVELGRLPAAPVLNFREQKQKVIVMELREREVEQKVVRYESQVVKVTDPCTGKCRTEYKSCPVVKTEKVKVHEVVPVEREVVVRVPVLEPGGEEVVTGLVLDQLTQPAVRRTFEAVTTNHALKVQVPVPVVCPPPAPPVCPAPGH